MPKGRAAARKAYVGRFSRNLEYEQVFPIIGGPVNRIRDILVTEEPSAELANSDLHTGRSLERSGSAQLERETNS